MAERKVDYDRGVIINVHPGTGMDVFMYVDAPGKYITAHSNEVSETIAREAGYDVEKLSKERTRLERKLAAAKLIDAELADDKDIEQVVVRERDGWKLVSFGVGRHNVVDPDGNVLNRSPLSLEMGEKIFVSFAGEEKVEEKPDGGGKKK
jgi:hypothetical protein